MRHLDFIYLCGPTAVGKSAIALELAERLSGEIISVDSMQVYRGLDIGTAKPSAAERARVPHHLIDVADLHETFDAARFAQLARQAAEEIRQRGRLPILCGGTGLYFKAFHEGVGSAPPADPQIRAALEQIPLLELLRELEARDPAHYAVIDRQNPRRVVRALEVIRLTGKPFSQQRDAWEPKPSAAAGEPANAPPAAPFRIIGIERNREELNHRIDARVEEMFAAGLVAETEALLPRGLAENRTASQAIGYRQVMEHLCGERGLPATVALVQQKTRQYAKRQMTWFRAQAGVEWIRLGCDGTPETVVKKITSAMG